MMGNRYGVGNKNHLGKKHDPATREKISAAVKAALSKPAEGS
jgi:hypothetical protein